MVDVQVFVKKLKEHGLSFFTGVPDSLLKSFCSYLLDHPEDVENVICANEGGAIGLAAGYYLGAGNPACVYMQNSGIGNAVNPLLSLADPNIYSIPMLMVIGWRGEPGKKDEPQHLKQGKTTLELLQIMGIEYKILDDNTQKACMQLDDLITVMNSDSKPVALVIRKDIFKQYNHNQLDGEKELLSREKALETILELLPEDCVLVSTTGMASRELFELREKRHEGHEKDFLTVGSMGHASQIALGIALTHPEKKVVCLDGDGALLMHLGSLAIIGKQSPENYIHIVLNNQAHDSVGGQPTAADILDIKNLAVTLGYGHSESVADINGIKMGLRKMIEQKGPSFLEIKIRKGARKDLGRPTLSPIENKQLFMNFINQK